MRRLVGSVVTILFALGFAVMVPGAAQAATPVIQGSSWLGGKGVNVCSPSLDVYCGGEHHVGGWPGHNWWECVELAQRLYQRMGWHSGVFPVSYAYQIDNVAPSMGMKVLRSGAMGKVKPGDMIIHEAYQAGALAGGHVAVVDRVEGSKVFAVQQNPAARVTYSLSGGTIYKSGRAVSAVVHSPANRLGSANPSVAIDFARSPRPGDIRVRGWARDADKPSAQLKVKVYVGGEYRGTLTAYRKKAGAKYSGHYYDGHVTTSKRGRQSVCVIAVNVGGGSNSKRCWWRSDWGTAIGRSTKTNGVALSSSCGHVGTIVRRPSDGASFLVKYDCKRYWISSGWHFERMVSNGVHVNRHLSKTTVNAIPSSGKRAAARTIDDGATGFQLYGPSSNITHVTRTSYGYDRDYRWTYWAKASKHENAAAWTHSLPRGVYRLKIYIPRRNAGAGVRYEVYDGHKVGNRIKRCDVYKKQANLSGWTNLCEVAIKSGKARIVLRDNRGTGPQYAHLGIDATRIIPMR